MPPREQQTPCQVDVLGGHLRPIATDGEHGLAAKQSDHPRDDTDPAGKRPRATDQADDRGDLDDLHRAEEVLPVGDVGGPGHRRDAFRLAEPRHEELDRQRMDVGVGICDQDQAVLGAPDAAIEPLGLAELTGSSTTSMRGSPLAAVLAATAVASVDPSSSTSTRSSG